MAIVSIFECSRLQKFQRDIFQNEVQRAFKFEFKWPQPELEKRYFKKDSLENFIKNIFALKNFLKKKCTEILVFYNYYNKFSIKYILHTTLTYDFN